MAKSKEQALQELKEMARNNPAAAMFLGGASIESMYEMAKNEIDVPFDEFKAMFEELHKYLDSDEE